MRNERSASVAQDACRGVGCAISGLHSRCRWQKKADAQMPWGALSVARRLPPTESVFRGRGIGSSVCGCDSRKYIHLRIYVLIHTYTYIYHHIRTYTYIYVFIDLGRLYTSNIHTYTHVYIHQRIAVERCFLGGAADARGHLDGLQPARSAAARHGTGL